jgi:O-antigen ligase
MGGDLLFRLPRTTWLLYSIVALVLSVGLLLLSQQRGPRELTLWLVAYGGIALVSLRLPQVAPLAGGAGAFLLGFVKTYRSGYDLDLGLSLIALSTGFFVLDRWRHSECRSSVDLAGVLLLLVAVWSMISLSFSFARIGSFTPAPGFAFHWYRFNPAGLSSQEAMIRAAIGATTVFVWFGLYEFARSARLHRKALNMAVFLLLLANGIILIVQRHVDPGFLLPVGFQQAWRLNGLTSFCYALGDVLLALFLLLPVWGVSRGRLGALAVASVVLLAHGVSASGSRTALFAALLATVLWATVRAGRLLKAHRRGGASLVLGAMALLVGLVGFAYRMTPADGATPLGRLKWEIEEEGLSSRLLEGRLSSYPLIFRVLGGYPLSGVGAGLYPAEVGKQHALLTPDLDILQPYLLSSFAPNQFLNTGVELGLPALIALALVFVYAAVRAVPRRGRGGSADLAVSLVVLALALQIGPSFHNSEALVFQWLIIGLAANPGSVSSAAPEPSPHRRIIGPRRTTAFLAGAVVLGISGHLLALPALAIDRQWKRLRWPMNIGMMAPEDGGRWTAPEATFTVRARARELILRWHAGDPAVPAYSAVVSFYVDGKLAEKSIARAGRIRESVLPLPEVSGLKRISVHVSPPFIPAEKGEGDDRRRLGIFIHSVKPPHPSSPANSP